MGNSLVSSFHCNNELLDSANSLNTHKQIRKIFSLNLTLFLNFTSKYFAQNCRGNTVKDKTDIFKKQYTNSILNQIFFKNVLRTNEIARP